MMRFISTTLGVLLAVALLSLPASVAAKPSKDVVERVDPSVGLVLASKGSGSSFVVGRNGSSGDLYLVTNFHVIEGSNKGRVGYAVNGEVKLFPYTVISKSAELDLAVLALKVGNSSYRPPAVPLAVVEVEKGDEVFALGFPGASDFLQSDRNSAEAFETTFTTGTVNKTYTGHFRRSVQRLKLVQHSTTVNPGNSGGPLFDNCGRVVGVNTVILKSSQPVSVSSSVSVLKSFLDSTDVPYATTTGPCDPNAPAEAAPEPVADPGSNTVFGMPIWGLALGGLAVLGAVGGIIAFAGKGATAPPQGTGDAPPVVDPSPVASVALKVAAKLPDGTQKAFKLSPGQLKAGATIGRTSSADITIDSPKISREHARIKLDGRRLVIEDLGSTNGVEVEGKRLSANSPEQINTRAKINLGNVTLRLAKP